MSDSIKDAFDYCIKQGAEYADIRCKDIQTEVLDMEDGIVCNISSERSRGYGIRVFIGGAMGFAATADEKNLTDTAKKACEIAEAGRLLTSNPIKLAKKEAVWGTYRTPYEIDPFTVPAEEKIKLLAECHAIMRKTADVAKTMSIMNFRREDVIFADTDGCRINQSFLQSSAAISARAVSDNDMQVRSYGNTLRAGYEMIIDMQLEQNARRISRESVELINAQQCPSGFFDLLLTPTQLQLQIHESVGHPTELDRIFGSEAAFAGTSFITPDNLLKKEQIKYGSEHVTIIADATADCAGGLGTFGFDDEGVPAAKTVLVDKGMLAGVQSSRDNSIKINRLSGGMGLSDGWQNMPIVRMTNINLMPGDFELENLIGGIEYGFMLDENKSWSIDDKRVNFQFACEIAYEIKDGNLTGKIFKDPIYTGKTTEFWGSCDGICHAGLWRVVGVPNCGKGQPMQIMRVAHGSAPSRFRKVKVGVSDDK
ncbi:MAG: TldD/PmbA family protein [Defluviitaleaceae bacterium]|nr:TldD/PmbA family protein [Defluviitaleaceae bacterium]